MKSAIYSLNSMPQKLVDKCIYIGKNISSTETDLNLHICKAWTVVIEEIPGGVMPNELNCEFELQPRYFVYLEKYWNPSPFAVK